jgi:site-specific recombinase XerD
MWTKSGRRVTPRDSQNIVKGSRALLSADVRRRAIQNALSLTTATSGLSSGAADVADVQKIVGHTSLATTGIYLNEI